MLRRSLTALASDVRRNIIDRRTIALPCRGDARRAQVRAVDADRRRGDHRDPAGMARLATGRALPRRGAILVLGAASGIRLLLEAAAHRLADLADHLAARRRR